MSAFIGHRMVLSVTLALVGLLPRATPGRTRTGRSAVSRSGLLRLEEPSPHASLVRRTGLEPQPSRLEIDLPLTRASSALDRYS